MAEAKKMGIYEKLMMVQQTLKAPKNQYNKFGNYHYRSCEDILEGLKDPLFKAKAAVTISDEIVCIADRVYVKATATFIDVETGEKVENSAYAQEPSDRKGMDVSQITGASSSYSRKYALNGLFLIDDNKDADTNENKTEKEERKKAEQPTEQEMKNTEKQYITEAKVKALMKQCEHDGVNPALVCEKCHVPDFSKLTEKQFSWLHGKWKEVFVNGN